MKKNKKILLIGGRSKERSLATSLISQGYRVTAINDSYEMCQQLADIKGLTVYNGDATKLYVLDEANAMSCDIAIALTSKDTDNLVACQLCKNKFGVKKTVAVVADPKKTEFFRLMGVDSVVCAISTITNVIQQIAFVDDMVNITSVGEGRVQIAEVHIPDNAPSAGRKLWELDLPKEVIIGCILRGSLTLIPKGDTRIEADDTLVIIARSGQETNAIKALTGRAE